MPVRRLLSVLLAAFLPLVLVSALLAGCAGTDLLNSEASLGTDSVSGLALVAEAELPQSAQDTLALIDAGGPFPYSQDGTTFQNREGILPEEPLGYYSEFTVPKPNEDDRGPWRLVTGAQDEVYWTEDHYASFARVQR